MGSPGAAAWSTGSSGSDERGPHVWGAIWDGRGAMCFFSRKEVDKVIRWSVSQEKVAGDFFRVLEIR